ncbi:extracellular solute-binding protein (family 3) [Dysgonomonas alginatilytica]|uniref:Extracellular solute-binding protein (Family 3) n=1 Tax=Dysgonomonas alginatilytica TaxID=1605892 RepID=A0A2V3PK42_9BACT|nr:transporter substrate-binding domain-containing protein [Dysgonomonas alginatilytica]PXV58422.1 extracellular solute-binding protein (family 3) [Dysgonomonas alginatilytica]
MKQKKLVGIVLTLTIVIAIIVYIMMHYLNTPVHRDYIEVEKSGTLHIVTDLNPIGYFVSSDTVAGYNYELLQALQQYTNINFEVSVENSLEKSFEGLKTGKYDLVARNIPVNSSLRNEYSFTEAIVNNRLVLVQRKGEFNNGIEPIRNHLDLGKKTLHVAAGSPNILRLQNLSHEIGDTIFIVEDDTYQANQLALMVAAGEIDYTVCDIKTAESLIAKTPELDIKTDIGFTHFEAWAVRANSPILLDSLNVWINRFKATEEYSKILKKYYK